MDNQLQSISKIFTEKIFRIPDYQRGYAWTEKQLKDFWTDIELIENNNHYVGVLTLEKVPESIFNTWEDDLWIIESKNYEPFYIVDGQQRLTTTIILIQAITEFIKEGKKLNYSTADEIKKKFIFESKDGLISRSYIFGYEKDNPSYEFLKTNIFNETSTSGYNNEVTIYTHNLDFAKKYFHDKLQELEITDIEIIYKKVTQNLLFNIYSISSDIDVFIAFETMNNRGKPLSNLELLKNRLIYLSTKLETSEHEKNKLRKIINDGWRGVYHYLGLNKDNPLYDDNFLHSHCTVFYGNEIYPSLEEEDNFKFRRGYFTPDSLEYYLLDKKFTLKNVIIDKNLDTQNIKKYVESLQDSVKIWFYIFNPSLSNDFNDKEKLALERINRLVGNTRNTSNFLLSLYLSKPGERIKLQILQKLEKFLFIVSIISYRAFIGPINFSIIGIKLLKGEMSLNEVSNFLDERISFILSKPDFINRVSENFRSNGGFYEWQGIKYFLYEYEDFLKSKTKNSSQKIDWNTYRKDLEDFITIEHIYPQTPRSECWKEKFNSYPLSQRKILNNSLGNLLPLSRPKNSSLQNRCFKDKIENGDNYIGFRFGSYSEIEVSKNKDWTPEDILKRGLILLKFMEKRWDLNFNNDENRTTILNLNFLI
ncbi:DUF262 domain-containing protein [Chryseobacterium sp. RU33C]|uniref:DUF262 domain-containing protein n=1 Tax=Chryseobacterium sp. RU33C TaxID=1907398 RepID=UPI0009554045|nr:DUF262 domain-containing protein [Chryseobacterium sp. RU33C]SIQ22682.1 Uncharacterized conserved protein, contains ParB-like and HNH nuclease domains [Chryseobacterium sp. RU33C]